MLDIQCDFDNHLTLHTYIAIVVLTLLYIYAHHFIHHWTNERTATCAFLHIIVYSNCHAMFSLMFSFFNLITRSIINFLLLIQIINASQNFKQCTKTYFFVWLSVWGKWMWWIQNSKRKGFENCRNRTRSMRNEVCMCVCEWEWMR